MIELYSLFSNHFNMMLLPYSDSVLLIVRAILAFTMLYYGWPKIKDLKSNAADFVSMGFKPGWFWGTMIAFLEFFGGLGMLFGIFVPLIALLFTFHMGVGTIWKITKTDKPFTDWSYDLLLLALMLMLLVTGPGSLSL